MTFMSPELSSQPESAALPSVRPEDEPLDAVVYDVHPALAPRAARTVYLYGSPGENPFQERPEDVYRPPPLFSFELRPPGGPQYVVPQRFGLSAILGIMTALALLFGIMRWLEADAGWYLFFGAQSVVICLVQMFHGKTPRSASAVAGAILAPLFVLGWAWFGRQDFDVAAVLCLMVACVPFGGFIGYLNGACAAGVFLVMDKLEPYLQGQRPAAVASPPVPAS
jgi:hypothetical protein